MAHQIEQFADGRAAFASARLDAWHRLGTTTRECMTAEEVMTTAHLGGWNVRKLPLTATEITDDGVSTVAVPDKFATVRTHPISGAVDYLGAVGTDYTPVQNEQHCELLNLLVDESGAHFETAGSLKGGRETFVTMKLPTGLRINGVDDVDLYIAGINSHDGSSAFRIVVTPVRVVCANTQHLALKRAKASYSVRHTSGAKTKIAEARQALGLVFDYCEAFEAEADKLIREELTRAEFEGIIGQLWPQPTSPSVRAANNDRRRRRHLLELFEHAPTNEAVRGSRWAGYQAITEYLDHRAPAKNADVRAARVLTSGDLARTKQRAYELLAV